LSKKEDYTITYCDEGITLPDILTKKHPYKNKKTGVIVYLSWWELYVDRQRELMARAFIYGMGVLEQKLHIDDWELLEETKALRVLYGQKEE
jgi:hypothetical protein